MTSHGKNEIKYYKILTNVCSIHLLILTMKARSFWNIIPAISLKRTNMDVRSYIKYGRRIA